MALVEPSPWMWNLNEGSLRALVWWWWHVTVSGPRCSAARGEKMDQAAVVFWAGLLRLPAPTGPFKLSTGHQLQLHSANFYSTSTLLSAFEWWYSTQNFFMCCKFSLFYICQAQHWLQIGIAAMIVWGLRQFYYWAVVLSSTRWNHLMKYFNCTHTISLKIP